MDNLFTSEGGILNVPTALRALAPKHKKALVDLPNQPGVFQTESRQKLVDMMKQTETAKEVVEEFQVKAKNMQLRPSTYQNLNLFQVDIAADIIRLAYTSSLQTLHMLAFQSCRMGRISPIFISPSLLRQRLHEINATLPEDMEFTIPLSEIQKYFQLCNVFCTYDSNGGLVEVHIPLTKKTNSYKLFEFRPITFAYEDNTCSLDFGASWVIKDLTKNDVYPITDVDEDSCSGSRKLCQVPQFAARDETTLCVVALLTGGEVSKIKEICKFHCIVDDKPALTAISDTVYVGVHLPPNEIKIACENQDMFLKEKVVYGAIRFYIPGGCRLIWNDKIIAASQGTFDEGLMPEITVLLPVQMATLDTLVPFTGEGMDSTVFSSAEEILDEDYDPYPERNPSSDFSPVVHLLPYGWNVIHTILFIAVFFKLRFVVAAIVAGTRVRGVEGATHTCKLPTDAYVLLISILFILILMIIPKIFKCFTQKIKREWNQTVDIAAVSRRIEDDEDL